MTMVVKELIDTRAELAQARREFEDLKYRNGMVEDSLRDNLLEAQAENARLREALETCVWLTGRWAENYLVGSESHKGRYKLLEGNSRRALAGKEPEA